MVDMPLNQTNPNQTKAYLFLRTLIIYFIFYSSLMIKILEYLKPFNRVPTNN